MFNKEEYQKYKDIRTNYAKNVKTKLNALYSNPVEFFNSRLTNYAVQERTSSLLDDADTKLKRDITDAALFEQIKTAIDTNSLDYFIDHLSSMKDNTPEMFEEAFGFEKGTGQHSMPLYICMCIRMCMYVCLCVYRMCVFMHACICADIYAVCVYVRVGMYVVCVNLVT
jgi:hypothetical protein